jgi:hypothetical protein
MPLQETVNRTRAHVNPTSRQEGVNAENPPGRVTPPQLEDAIGEVSVDSSRAPVGAAGVIPQPLYASLSVVSTPIAQGPLGDPEEPADLPRVDPLLNVLFDRLESESNVFLDHCHPLRGRQYVLTIQAARRLATLHLLVVMAAVVIGFLLWRRRPGTTAPPQEPDPDEGGPPAGGSLENEDGTPQ